MAQDIEYADPRIDEETRAFWEGCGRHELVLQRCADCGTVQHRPRGLCASCLSDRIEHFVASGRGTVYTYTITHQNGAPRFARALPYVMAYVDLEEGPRLLTNLVDCDPERLGIGMPVRVDFVDTGKFAIPRFKPA